MSRRQGRRQRKQKSTIQMTEQPQFEENDQVVSSRFSAPQPSSQAVSSHSSTPQFSSQVVSSRFSAPQPSSQVVSSRSPTPQLSSQVVSSRFSAPQCSSQVVSLRSSAVEPSSQVVTSHSSSPQSLGFVRPRPGIHALDPPALAPLSLVSASARASHFRTGWPQFTAHACLSARVDRHLGTVGHTYSSAKVDESSADNKNCSFFDDYKVRSSVRWPEGGVLGFF